MENYLYLYSVIKLDSLAPEITQVILTPEKNILAYHAGQYVAVSHLNHSTSYLSIACAPKINRQLEFQVHHPVINAAACDLINIAKEKQQWLLQGPYGHCSAEKLYSHKPIIFIARNTGFASIKAVIEVLVQRKNFLPINFYWCVPSEREIYLPELITRWTKEGINFTPIYTKIFPDHLLANQYLIKEIQKDHSNISSYQIYVSGPKKFVANIYQALKVVGLRTENFFSDLF